MLINWLTVANEAAERFCIIRVDVILNAGDAERELSAEVKR